MSKKLTNKILISISAALTIGLAALYGFRMQGRQRTLNLRTATAEVVEIRLREAGTPVRLFREADEWRLSHPALPHPVPADGPAVEALLDDLRHWEVKTLVPAQALDSTADTADTSVSGRLRVYTQRRWGGLFGHRKVWDGRYRRTDSALYLRDSRRLYSRLYDPGRTGEGGEAALSADVTTDLRHWRDRWISHYYYYDIAQAEWQDADGRHFVYQADASLPGQTPYNQHQIAALSAFRAVRFDRYAEAADSAAIAVALSAPPAAVFSVVSTRGDSTRLSAFTLYDTAGQADWFRLCGILEKYEEAPDGLSDRTGKTASDARRDTVFLSYQLLDRLRAALAAVSP